MIKYCSHWQCFQLVFELPKGVMATAVNLLFTKLHLKNITDQSYLSNCCCLPHYHKLLQKLFKKYGLCCKVTLAVSERASADGQNFGAVIGNNLFNSQISASESPWLMYLPITNQNQSNIFNIMMHLE